MCEYPRIKNPTKKNSLRHHKSGEEPHYGDPKVGNGSRGRVCIENF